MGHDEHTKTLLFKNISSRFYFVRKKVQVSKDIYQTKLHNDNET